MKSLWEGNCFAMHYQCCLAAERAWDLREALADVRGVYGYISISVEFFVLKRTLLTALQLGFQQ
jgi:hypothetical protein